MVVVALRIIILFLLEELVAFARARSAIGAWIPDPLFATCAVLALAGRREIIVPAAVLMALLRAPTALADPFAPTAALISFAAIVAAARRFITRERPALVFMITSIGFVYFQWIESMGIEARSAGPAWSWSGLLAAAPTGLLAVLLVPTLRALSLTHRMIEKRLGE